MVLTVWFNITTIHLMQLYYVYLFYCKLSTTWGMWWGYTPPHLDTDRRPWSTIIKLSVVIWLLLCEVLDYHSSLRVKNTSMTLTTHYSEPIINRLLFYTGFFKSNLICTVNMWWSTMKLVYIINKCNGCPATTSNSNICNKWPAIKIMVGHTIGIFLVNIITI